jgi:cell division protein FtsX
MNIELADITVHIDQTLAKEQRSEIEEKLRGIEGVVSVHNPDDRPHLTIVEYNPDATTSEDILNTVASQGVNAELIGL